ncbi:hypothetical protein BDF14DRAFT_1807486 [Spinellus fusiger]|nr:hypothetical protein BDF14DRAFT_1807486 [Spinellus fusiger]
MSPPSNSTPTHLQLHQKEQERKFIERQQVQVLLENYNLSQYYNVLIEEGFDRLESLFEVTEKDLVELCVKRGHRRLLQRAIHNAKGFPPTTPLHINVDPSMSTDSNNEASFRSISTKYDTPYEYDWHLGKSIMTEHDMVSYQRTITSPGNTRPNSIESSRETRGTVATAVTVSHTTDRSMKTTNTLPNPSTPKEVMTLGEAEHCSSTALPYRHDTAVPYHLPSPMSSSLALSNSHAPLGTGTSGMSSTEDDTLPSDGTGRPWKRKYQRHAKPDRNSPVKPASAYVMFSNRVRDELRSHNMSFTELAKLVGDRWKNLNQKEKENYEVDAMQARMHYQKMLEEYQKTDEFKVNVRLTSHP